MPETALPRRYTTIPTDYLTELAVKLDKAGLLLEGYGETNVAAELQSEAQLLWRQADLYAINRVVSGDIDHE